MVQPDGTVGLAALTAWLSPETVHRAVWAATLGRVPAAGLVRTITRIVGHDAVATLRATLRLPSLDAVFAALVHEENLDDRTRGLLAAMKR